MADTTRSKIVPRASGGAGVQQRRGAGGSGAARTSANRTAGGGTGAGGLWRFYTEDSSGLKIGPVVCLVISLVFIGSVFVLHIWADTKLMDVKLKDLVDWFGRRDWTPGAMLAEIGRNSYMYARFYFHPLFESAFRWLWRFVLFTTVLKIAVGNLKYHQETLQAEYHW